MLKRVQFLFEIRYLFLDLAELCLSLGSHQIVLAKLLSYVLLELAPQDSEVWVSPYRPISVFEFGRLNTSDDEITVNTVLRLGCYVAKGCSLSIPFAILRHAHPLLTERFRAPDGDLILVPRSCFSVVPSLTPLLPVRIWISSRTQGSPVTQPPSWL